MDILERIDNKITDQVFESKEVQDTMILLEETTGVSKEDTKKGIVIELKRLSSLPIKQLLKSTEKSFDVMVKTVQKSGKEKQVLKVLNKKFDTDHKTLSDVKLVTEKRMKYNDSETYHKFVDSVKRGFMDFLGLVFTITAVMVIIGTS
ncbi:MAG: hypothetical protein KAS32_11210, partial [Candidatus Peribacteraceae bacterium]|nr:hypothetical protein [Candidatus Peribacteraceae bacterium]